MKVVVGLTFLLSASIGADWSNNDDLVPLSSIESRIHGGVVANFGSFPYMVAMFTSKPNGGGLCGGSLISDAFVLTAAHCLYGATTAKVYLGARSILVESDPNRLEFVVGQEGLIIHEYYDGSVHLHDIALIRLPQRVQFTSEIRPVRLPRRGQTNLDYFGTIITGWGQMGNKYGSSEFLRYAQLRILPDDICSRFYTRYYHPSNICIEGAGQSACPGDSGGAAVIVDREDGYLTQVGLTSYGHYNGCESGYPVSYIRVSSYLDWIKYHTGIPIRE